MSKVNNDEALAALASSPVARTNATAKTWVLTETGITTGASVGGQAGVILRALASLGGTASTTEIVERINQMRDEEPIIETIMAGKADQGTSTVVAHYAGEKTTLRRKGFVVNG